MSLRSPQSQVSARVVSEKQSECALLEPQLEYHKHHSKSLLASRTLRPAPSVAGRPRFDDRSTRHERSVTRHQSNTRRGTSHAERCGTPRTVTAKVRRHGGDCERVGHGRTRTPQRQRIPEALHSTRGERAAGTGSRRRPRSSVDAACKHQRGHLITTRVFPRLPLQARFGQRRNRVGAGQYGDRFL